MPNLIGNKLSMTRCVSVSSIYNQPSWFDNIFNLPGFRLICADKELIFRKTLLL